MDWDGYGTDFAGPVSVDEDYESVAVEVPEIVLSEEGSVAKPVVTSRVIRFV